MGRWGIAGAIDVVATRDNTCALLGDGHVRCWGSARFGQNGDGTMATRVRPVEVLGITDAQEIGASHATVCVRHATGTVSCWGASLVGDGTLVSSPTLVEGVAGSTHLRASLSFFCSDDAAGVATCFGSTPLLGAATAVGVSRPDLAGVLAAANNYTYVREADGSVTVIDARGTRRTRTDLVGITSLAIGHDHSCAIAADGHVLCWGSDDRGQLGLGESGNTDEVRPVENLEGATAVVNGDGFGCALHGGGVTCWGDNSYGQLGRSIRRDMRPTAVNVSSPLTSHVIALAAGQNHVCAVRRDGTVWCWGDDTHGTLGDGRATYRTEPTLVDLTIPEPAAEPTEAAPAPEAPATD